MDDLYLPFTKLNLFSRVFYKGHKNYILFIKFLDFQHFLEYLSKKEGDYDKVFFRDYIIFNPKTFKFEDIYPTDLDLCSPCKKITLK